MIDSGPGSDTAIDLSGKVALVTGAAGGIGGACASFLARCGAATVATDIDLTTVADLPEDALGLKLDVGSADSWATAIEKVRAKFDRLDILVNAAGINVQNSVVDCLPETYARIVSVNQTGTFLGIRAAAPLIAVGGGGAIVNVASISTLRGYPDSVAYASSKAAVLGITKSAARDLAAEGIRVNAVEPGIIDTPMQATNTAELQEAVDRMLSVPGRMGTPLEVAKVVAFLASDLASYVTGAQLLIDGGVTLGGG